MCEYLVNCLSFTCFILSACYQPNDTMTPHCCPPVFFVCLFRSFSNDSIDGCVWDSRNSIAGAHELLWSCTIPLIWCHVIYILITLIYVRVWKEKDILVLKVISFFPFGSWYLVDLVYLGGPYDSGSIATNVRISQHLVLYIILLALLCYCIFLFAILSNKLFKFKFKTCSTHWPA